MSDTRFMFPDSGPIKTVRAIVFPVLLLLGGGAWAQSNDWGDPEQMSTLLLRATPSPAFTAFSDLEPTLEGLLRTTDGTATLYGDIEDPRIDSIRVNGNDAPIDSAGSWSLDITTDIDLLTPGVNRVLVQALDRSGELFGQQVLDIYWDSGRMTEVSGELTGDSMPSPLDIFKSLFSDHPWHLLHWTREQSPYLVTGDVTVPSHHRLEIEAGVSVFFTPGSRMTINGELVAAGEAGRRIQMRTQPGLPFTADIRPELKSGPPHWNGVQFRDSESSNNRIAHTDIDRAQTVDGSIGLFDAELHIDDVAFSGTHQRMIYTDSSSLLVENCIFPDMFAGDEFPFEMTPPIDNYGEHIKGIGRFPTDGYYIVRNNYFGTNKGHNDVIDVDSNQYPDSILQILDNYFAGAGDEPIDGGGDILIEGNVFRNIIKDRDNDGDGEANAISTGDTLNTVVVVTRNLFFNLDHVINFKRDAFGYLEHNTVIGISKPRWALDTDPPARMLDFSVINLLIPDRNDPDNAPPRDPPGHGAWVSGNIFTDVPQPIFGNPDRYPPDNPQVSSLDFQRNLVESGALLANSNGKHGRQFDYRSGRPEFADSAAGNYRLGPGSPGYREGPNGLDMGALVPAGASISGEPEGRTTRDSASLTIAGPGIFSFVYRVNDDDWSDEITIQDPAQYRDGPIRRTATLQLDNLDHGDNTIYVRGRNFAGVLQGEDQATASKTWRVE